LLLWYWKISSICNLLGQNSIVYFQTVLTFFVTLLFFIHNKSNIYTLNLTNQIIVHMFKLKTFILSTILFIPSYSIFCQTLDKEIIYGNVTIKIPVTWEYKTQVVENIVIQVACWDNNTGSTLLVQYCENLLNPSDYINSIINYQKTLPLHSNANYSPILNKSFHGIKSEETEFTNYYKGEQLKGRIIAFNFDNSSYSIVYHGKTSFYNSSLLDSILNSIIINSERNRNSIKDGWSQYEIDNIAVINIPPSLELRDDNSAYSILQETIIENYIKKKIKINNSNLIFQPTGRNNLKKESFQSYSRILISYLKGSEGDFYKYNEDLSLITQEEISELNAYLRNQAEEPMKHINTKIIKWFPLEILNINNKTTIRLSFIRQMDNEKPVFVESYKFFNFDEQIEITLSFRLEDSNIWEDDFKEVVNSFNFLILK